MLVFPLLLLLRGVSVGARAFDGVVATVNGVVDIGVYGINVSMLCCIFVTIGVVVHSGFLDGDGAAADVDSVYGVVCVGVPLYGGICFTVICGCGDVRICWHYVDAVVDVLLAV